MDILSIVGFILAMVAILVGAMLKGAGLQGAAVGRGVHDRVRRHVRVDLHPDAAAGVQAGARIVSAGCSGRRRCGAEALIQKIIEWSQHRPQAGVARPRAHDPARGGRLRAEGSAARGRRRRTRRDPRHHGSGARRARARRQSRGEGVGGHGHLFAHARHHRRGAGPDGRDAEPRRSVASSATASPRRSPRRSTASASPTCSSCRSPASSRASSPSRPRSAR